ncbi:hypothetical protein GTP45_01215 [Pseudoduganella sp. FT55W]|uniref:Arc family DNA-binding protein n=1 Tax=Duganella rivi TaxID=2666083 RepID=A0A7X4KA15_9BURK|nr:hypothetical protein [Duganella rivi]MYM65452.1 hypothetical protein [Duganella rivi]
MTKQKPPKDTHQTTLRMSKQMHSEIKDVADSKGWSVNDEVNFRLRAFSLHQQMLAVAADVTDIKAMLRRLVDSQ